MFNEIVSIDSKLAAAEAGVLELDANVKQLTVSTDADLETAAELLVRIAERKKDIERDRVFFTGPLNQQVKAINERFQKLAQPLVAADTAIRTLVLKYRERQRELARIEQDKLAKQTAQAQQCLEKKAEKFGVTAPVLATPLVAEQPRTVAGVSARTTWAFEVVDATLVPREYLVVDTPAIRKAVHAGARAIPGVRIYEAESLAVRG